MSLRGKERGLRTAPATRGLQFSGGKKITGRRTVQCQSNGNSQSRERSPAMATWKLRQPEQQVWKREEDVWGNQDENRKIKKCNSLKFRLCPSQGELETQVSRSRLNLELECSVGLKPGQIAYLSGSILLMYWKPQT